MNKIFKHISIALGVVMLAGSCSKFLDVKPETSVTEDDAFKSKSSIYAAMNGVYLTFGSEDMYGGMMNMVVPEVLGQRYYQPSDSKYNGLATFSYTNDKVKGWMGDYWSNGYKLIANLNNILDHLPAKKSLFTEKEYNILYGEALALRTFMHFDLLRMYGPVYNSADSAKTYIPYYSWRSADARPYLAANTMMDSLQRDINSAIVYLVEDVLTSGVAMPTKDNYEPRKCRFNFFAAKTLQARMMLYRNDKAGAFTVANEVINVQPIIFSFTGKNAADVAKDPSLLGDVIFATENTKLPITYNDYFVYTLDASALLAPRTEVLDVIYPETGDARKQTAVWRPAPDGSKSVCYYKYAPIYVQSGAVKIQTNITVPVIRASECYLIAAEADPDPVDGVKYLDVLRGARNILLTLPTAVLRTELTKEYRREFFGEGQMFFYYKRINSTTVPNSTGTSTTATVSMNTAKYVPPVPDVEKMAH